MIEGYNLMPQFALVNLTGFKVAHIITFIILIAVIGFVIYQYMMITKLMERSRHLEVQMSVLRRDIDDVKAAVATLTASTVIDEKTTEVPRKRRPRKKKNEVDNDNASTENVKDEGEATEIVGDMITTKTDSVIAESDVMKSESNMIEPDTTKKESTESTQPKVKRVTKKAIREAQMKEALANGEKIKAEEPETFGW